MSSRSTVFSILFNLTLSVFSIHAVAQGGNPLEGSFGAARAGGALFRAQCATCHGADAEGINTIDAPDLTLMWSEGGRSDAEVFNIIRDGIAGTIMPPHNYNDTQTWMLVTYLRSVGVRGVSELPPGDGSRGSQLFANNCSGCHRVAGMGGSMGPNLSALLNRRPLEYIETAVRDPSAYIVPGFRTVIAWVPNNVGYEGRLLNEDAFSVQIMDAEQQLRSFTRPELVAVEKPQRSLMPVFSESALAQQDVIDILHFIRNTQAGDRR